MEIGKAIYKLLKDSADVGAICADRIYPEMAQQDVDVPFIVYTVTDTTPSATKNATSKLDTGRVELYVISDDYEQAMNLGIAVRTALDRQSGTISAVEVQSIDFDTSDIQFDPDQRVYVLEQTYDVRIQRTGTAQVVSQFAGNTFTVEEVDGDPSGAVNKLVFSNGSVSITDRTATITTGGAAGVSYHGRYDTEAETERSGATATLEVYYTARPDGDGFAESEVSDVGETDTINRTLFYSTKFQANPDTAGDWTQYTTQPADNATFATAKAALLAGLNDTDATAETRGTLPLSLKMVRTTSVAAVDLLLDTYPNASAAFSVRKLDKDYVGSCMRIRRDSDDAETDIGFDGNGDLSTTAIATFCASANGYCVTWYDQSGNSNNATQGTASAQPQIYNGTAVITENGKPALDTNTAGQRLVISSSTTLTQPYTPVSVGTGDLNTPYHRSNLRLFQTSGNLRFHSGTQMTLTMNASPQCLSFAVANGASSLLAGSTSTTQVNTTGNAGTTDLALNLTDVGNRSTFDNGGLQQELIFWDSDQSSNRTGIEADINSYFSIF